MSMAAQVSGLPLDRVGRITQKALEKKYPYQKKGESSGGFGSGLGGFGKSGFEGFGGFNK